MHGKELIIHYSEGVLCIAQKVLKYDHHDESWCVIGKDKTSSYLVAVDTSLDGNQMAAILGGISRIKHWAQAAIVCPMKADGGLLTLLPVCISG